MKRWRATSRTERRERCREIASVHPELADLSVIPAIGAQACVAEAPVFGTRSFLAACSRPTCAVADLSLEIIEEDAERGLRSRRPVKVACPLQDESADASFFATVEPIAVTVGAGVELQRVTAVIEPVHRLGADRTRSLAWVRLILDGARQNDRVADRGRFQRGEFVVEQPLATAGRTDLDRQAGVRRGLQLSVSHGAEHQIEVYMRRPGRTERSVKAPYT